VPCTGAYYPEISSAFIRFWEPASFFNKIEVWSWGKNYKMEKGADAYFMVSSTSEKQTLQPKEHVSFKVFITALENVGEKDTINSHYEKAKSFLN
ncbi:MAG: hypothetical protein KAR18_03165, partial [Spirochaetes bacterium]|nr:hypothetical protein [Spirochaetota bacterium]